MGLVMRRPHLGFRHLGRHAEIGFEHALIVMMSCAVPSASFFALVEHDHAMAEVGDELDIVLDDQEGFAGPVELRQRHLDLANVARIDAGYRLVEHDDLGCGMRAAASATSFF